jgi:hypothetical protein
MVAVMFSEVKTVEIGNVTEVAPRGKLTDAGTMALAEFEDNATLIPGPALPLNVIVPVAEAPQITDVGETARVDRLGPIDQTIPQVTLYCPV